MKELLHDDDIRRDAIAEGMANGIAKGRIEGLAEGRTEGERAGRLNAIQRLLVKGVEMDFIQSLDYSEEEIQEAQTAMLTTP